MRQEMMLRHWKILRRLEEFRRGLTSEELAEEFKVSARTIYRDLVTLQEAGFPFSSESTGNGMRYYLTKPAGAIDKMAFGPSELLALYMSQGILSQLRGTVFQESIDQLMDKVREVVPASVREHFRSMEASILIESFRRRNYFKRAREIHSMLSSLRDRTVLRMVYFSPNRGELERELDPYCLWVMGDSLYLIGFCHLNNEIRTFLVDRIQQAYATKKPFVMNSGFDFRKYTSESFRVMRGGQEEEFELKFAQSVSHLIKERIWHPSQVLKTNPDGSVSLTFSARGLEEVKSWALSFGEQVEVIKPERLRREIKSCCQKILKSYCS
jgi:proteasome accessory factor B